MEIERKWLIDSFPIGLELIEECDAEQMYISTKPVVRIRKMVGGSHHPFRLCFKGKGTLVRQEIEMDLTEEKYEELKEFCGKAPITKEYKVYLLPNGEHLEVSCVDKGTSTEFMYAEVEFDTVEQAHAFVTPEFLGKEITDKKGVSMSDYWINTRV